jgi:hypothetical protein
MRRSSAPSPSLETPTLTRRNTMARITLGNGKWFNDSTATRYEENTRWNGNNHISCATGSQWDHEALYRTKSGTWVIHSWSQWQGSTPSYEVISDEDAYNWLIAQGESDAVPAAFLASKEI